VSAARWIRHAIDVAARGTGALARMRRASTTHVTVLMYHRVLPDAECKSYPLSNLVVAQSHFARQCAWLASEARVMTARDAIASGPGGPNERPIVCLTFDDGYADNAEVAAPLLEHHGLRATFYVTTDFVETRGMLWFDRASFHFGRVPDACRAAFRRRLAEGEREDDPRTLDGWMGYLKRASPERRAAILGDLDREDDLASEAARVRPMTIEQVKRLADRGHEIGSHTRTHPMLPQLHGADLDREIGGARETLRRWTSDEVQGFCYPNGDASDEAVEAIRRAGHSYAFTTKRGVNAADDDPMRLRRRMVSPGGTTGPRGGASAAAFWSEVVGLHDRMRRWR